MKAEEKAFERAKRDVPFRYLGVVRCIIHDAIEDTKKELHSSHGETINGK